MGTAEDCPICNASDSANANYATALVAEHILELTPHDKEHRQWVKEHTETGTIAEIRAALSE